ncbi:MAG: acylpyruvase [Thermoplasmatales archaeon SG8-52-3]|nr:MAG: acylpyruvase [Thermoplasmatales archaeon SG8-52-3]
MMYYKFKDGVKRDITIGKIVCLARSYKKHAQEMNSDVPKEPVIFLKPASSVIFNGDKINIPKMSNCLHHEVELGIIIGKRCKLVNKKDALNFVLGYLIGLDITARDIQSDFKKKGWPWTIAKSFDTFAPISDVVLKELVSDPQNLDISLKVNGKLKQDSNTSFMIFSIEEIIEFISKVMTLEPGDLILTGTPEGVDEIKKGDILEAKLGNICSLKVFVD